MRDDDSIRKKLSRRKYAKLVAGSGIAALAGCPGDGDGETDTPTDEPDTDTATEGDSTPTETATPDPADRMRDTARVWINNPSPDNFNWNPHTPQDNTAGDLYMAELDGFANVTNASQRLHGDEAVFESPWVNGHDEIELVTWVKDWRTEPPYDMYNTHDERSTFWNGEPNDAVARYKHQRVTYFVDGNKYVPGAANRAEASSQWVYHWWNSDGSLPQSEDNPQNKIILDDEAARTGGDPPLPPGWTDPWLRQFEATGTEESYNGVISKVQGDQVSLERIANNGWGTGPFELRSTDDIASTHITLRVRDSEAESPHPHADHITVPKLQLQFGESTREGVLANEGEIDVHQGSITPNNDWNPESLPSHIKNITTYPKSDGGDSWWLNWNNPHLGRLWVRRALVTAIDWVRVGGNGWGPERTIPLEHDTGTLDAWSRAIFSEEFLNTIHSYPKEADVETANDYMEKAGYTKEGGTWVDPDGNTFQLDVLLNSGIGDWVGACQTIRDELQSFGVEATLTANESATWQNKVDTYNNPEPNYETTIHWFNPSTRFQTYKSQAAWWDNGSLIGGDPNGEGGDRRSVEPDDEWTITGEPVQVHLPEDKGSLEAPNQAGAKPDLEGVTEYREVNIAEVMQNLRAPEDDPEVTQERFRTCAQYYNYDVPKFVFHQYTFGEWGNVRDFEWPDADDPSLDWSRDFNITDVVTLGGIMQASYDDELDR